MDEHIGPLPTIYTFIYPSHLVEQSKLYQESNYSKLYGSLHKLLASTRLFSGGWYEWEVDKVTSGVSLSCHHGIVVFVSCRHHLSGSPASFRFLRFCDNCILVFRYRK